MSKQKSVTLPAIQSFLASKEFAIAGVSRNPKKFGRQVYDLLKERGFTLYPVNPNTESINGDTCYKQVSDLPEKVDRIFIVTPPEETADAVRQAVDRDIRNLWIQQRSETPEVEEILRDKKVNLITHRCILMFAEPVKGAHAFHRFLARLFGSYPKSG